LFAVGTFLAFTLSKAGMTVHWKRTGGRHARKSMFVNALGATATGAATMVVLVSKMAEGACITLVAIPAIVVTMQSVHRPYRRVSSEVAEKDQLEANGLQPPIVVVPMDDWNRITHKGLRFAMSLPLEVIA
jgi:hypothetical protein